MKKKKHTKKNTKNEDIIRLQASIRRALWLHLEECEGRLAETDDEIMREISNEIIGLDILDTSEGFNLPVKIQRKTSAERYRDACWLQAEVSKFADQIFELVYKG